MATYNGAPFIMEQVASILNQLGTDDELIISDDGSTDQTLTLLRQFNDKRVKILSNPSPRSITRNFENALKNASANYIFMADQDDIWYSNKISVMSEKLREVDLVISNCDFINENGHALESSFFETFRSGPGVLKNFTKNTFLGNCMAFNRTVLDKILPFPNELHSATRFLIYQDVWIGLMANSTCRVAFLPNKLSAFRRHGRNASPTDSDLKSPQTLMQKIQGRSLLAIALLKRLSKIS